LCGNVFFGHVLRAGLNVQLDRHIVQPHITQLSAVFFAAKNNTAPITARDRLGAEAGDAHRISSTESAVQWMSVALRRGLDHSNIARDNKSAN
jgi:hypothetical protein